MGVLLPDAPREHVIDVRNLALRYARHGEAFIGEVIHECAVHSSKGSPAALPAVVGTRTRCHLTPVARQPIGLQLYDFLAVGGDRPQACVGHPLPEQRGEVQFSVGTGGELLDRWRVRRLLLQLRVTTPQHFLPESWEKSSCFRWQPLESHADDDLYHGWSLEGHDGLRHRRVTSPLTAVVRRTVPVPLPCLTLPVLLGVPVCAPVGSRRPQRRSLRAGRPAA